MTGAPRFQIEIDMPAPGASGASPSRTSTSRIGLNNAERGGAWALSAFVDPW